MTTDLIKHLLQTARAEVRKVIIGQEAVIDQALIAIFTGIFGFIAVGPAGLILFAVFFVLFLWSMVRERTRGKN